MKWSLGLGCDRSDRIGSLLWDIFFKGEDLRGTICVFPWPSNSLFIVFSHLILKGRGRPEVQVGPPVSFPQARKMLR